MKKTAALLFALACSLAAQELTSAETLREKTKATAHQEASPDELLVSRCTSITMLPKDTRHFLNSVHRETSHAPSYMRLGTVDIVMFRVDFTDKQKLAEEDNDISICSAYLDRISAPYEKRLSRLKHYVDFVYSWQLFLPDKTVSKIPGEKQLVVKLRKQ